MKKFLLMHVGFEKPTPEVMKAWGAWFESIKEQTLESTGLMAGKEISKDGVKDLPWGLDSLTGFNIVQAESIDEAQKLAETCPYISSIRVYELRTK